MHALDEFIELIKELICVFQELTPIEETKLNAVKDSRVTIVEDCMNKEQVCLMKVRGLEQKRDHLQQELSFEGKTLNQIVPLLPEPHRQMLEELSKELRAAFYHYRAVSEKANAMLEVSIQNIDQAIAQLQQKKKESSAVDYSPTGKPKSKDFSFVTRKI